MCLQQRPESRHANESQQCLQEQVERLREENAALREENERQYESAIRRDMEKGIMVAQGAPQRLKDYDRVSVRATARHIVDEIKAMKEALR